MRIRVKDKLSWGVGVWDRGLSIIEETVGFTPDGTGDKQKVAFLLYGLAESEVYQRLHLLVDVQ